MKLHAYAKINLSLIVTGKQDPYHLLDSIMLSCKDPKDTVKIKKPKRQHKIFSDALQILIRTLIP